jgi:uncharacterized protein YutD
MLMMVPLMTCLTMMKLNQIIQEFRMAKNQKPSRDNEVVFKSYQDVITKNMKAGKDVTRLTQRLNNLLSKYKG